MEARLAPPNLRREFNRSFTDSHEDDDHVHLLFSATFPKEARALAKEYMAKDHVRVRVGRTGSTHTNVMQKVHSTSHTALTAKADMYAYQIIYVDESKKRDCLFDLLLSMPPARTIVFVNNKKAADFLDDFLYNRDLPSTSIHSDRTQREREDALYVTMNPIYYLIHLVIFN